MIIKTVGSVCSGIEAASVAWEPLGLKFKWFSEIAPFPSSVLKEKYPNIPNLGDMNNIPSLITTDAIEAPDLICGGTPCQAFSLAGWKNGLNDDRGNLTLKFAEIIEANDNKRTSLGLSRSIVFWENVEGVLTDKTNAFGCFISLLAGTDEVVLGVHWPNSGVVYGKIRNIAWRVLDAKYFGLPQQRRRLYVLAGGKDFHPENVLFEQNNEKLSTFPSRSLTFDKDGHRFEVFREYTDCLYAAYGTKWNGNAAATNGSLFIVQDERIRRLSPLECERLMGFPDNYTDLPHTKKTSRYQAVGNSWAVPVINWIGQRLLANINDNTLIQEAEMNALGFIQHIQSGFDYIPFGKDIVRVSYDKTINCTAIPEECVFGTMQDIVSPDAPEDIYISPVGCYGIIRRKEERNTGINKRLEKVLLSISSQMSSDEIEKRSRVQKRGKFSVGNNANPNGEKQNVQMTLFDDTIDQESFVGLKLVSVGN